MVFNTWVDRVPCLLTAPLDQDLKNRAYRDCSRPDLRNGIALPWITRANMDDVLADLRRGTSIIPGARPDPGPRKLGSPWPRYVGLGITGALTVASVAAYLRFDKYRSRVSAATWEVTADPARAHENDRLSHKWAKITLGTAGAAVVAGAITL
jgi:hypothetical protein